MKNLIDVIGKILMNSKESLKKMEILEAWKDFSYDMEIEIGKIEFGEPIKKTIQAKKKPTKGKPTKKEN